ncbi:hypothetical protein HT134_06475 [Nonomuraea rhodomycinica]|uniref:Peptidase S9A N-terminal domain-containing protein n=1 Tax=Nonomuraea rhodomycinica TaxID=1712872 RepID=A0A7Y6IKH4_9ACTN|nr:hypothetical protein [Nonomuraea rhodomycinica]
MSDITEPPIARVDVVRETLHGITIEDPYRWMETEGEEFRHWLDGQARHAREHLDALPHRAGLLTRIRELGSALTRYFGLAMAADKVFALVREPDARVPVLTVTEAGGASRVLFDPGTVPGDGHHAIDWYVPSPDGRHIACAVSASGSEDSSIHVIDAGSGALRETIPPTTRFAFLSWLEDSRSFVYHRYAEQHLLDSRTFLHHLGADPAQDTVVLARGLNPRIELTPRDRPFLVVPPHGEWMLAIISHDALSPWPWTSEQLSDCTIYVAPRTGLADPAACPWRLVAGVADGVTTFATSHDTLYLVSHRDAPRSRVLAVPLAAPDLSRARVVVPAGERVVESVRVVGDRLLVRDLDGGVSRVRHAPLSGGEPADLTMPVDGTILEWTTHPTRPEALLLVAGWTDAPRLYRYDGQSLQDTGLAPRSLVDFGDVHVRICTCPRGTGRRSRSRSSTTRTWSWTATTRPCSPATAPTGSSTCRSSVPRCSPGTSVAASTPSRTCAAAAPTAASGTRPGAARARRPPSRTSSTAPSISSPSATPARDDWPPRAPAAAASPPAARWCAAPICGPPWRSRCPR